MAHYALINENNEVVQIITGIDENISQIDIDGSIIGGSSEAWEEFYSSRPWFTGLYCKRTSYNNNYRKRYAKIGDTYNQELDAFISPKPFKSWNLNENTCDWDPPVPYPNDNNTYYWNEDSLEWKAVNIY